MKDAESCIDGEVVMGEVTWRRANGTTGVYKGEVWELGVGIPRHLPEWGLRRALSDLAYGYTSGFPLRDIIPYCLRALFPPSGRIPTVHAEPIEDHPQAASAGRASPDMVEARD